VQVGSRLSSGRGFAEPVITANATTGPLQQAELVRRVADQPASGELALDDAIDRCTVIRMHTVTISPKFQVVIPQAVREALGLRSGEKAQVIPFRNRIEIIPVREVRRLRGMLKGANTSFKRGQDRA
jgi:AbrB family looped-hinge helix DNA binding protein